MARTGITFEQVAAVADRMVGAGEQPTIKAVREALGSGSPNTIHAHLTAWRAARPQAAAVARELPARIIDAINDEIEQATASARSEIETQLVQAQAEAAELAAAGEALEEERDELAGQIAVLTTERDTLAGKADEQGREIVRLTADIERERTATEQARIEVAQGRLKVEAQAGDLARLMAEVERLTGSLSKETEARIEAEKSAAVLTAKIDASVQRTEAAEQRAHAAETQVKTLAGELSAASSQASEQQHRITLLMGSLDAEKTACTEARQEAKKAIGDAAELRGKLSAMTDEIAELRRQIAHQAAHANEQRAG